MTTLHSPKIYMLEYHIWLRYKIQNFVRKVISAMKLSTFEYSHDISVGCYKTYYSYLALIVIISVFTM